MKSGAKKSSPYLKQAGKGAIQGAIGQLLAGGGIKEAALAAVQGGIDRVAPEVGDITRPGVDVLQAGGDATNAALASAQAGFNKYD